MIVVVAQLLSCVWLCNPMNYTIPGFPDLHCYLFKLTSIGSMMPSNHLILCLNSMIRQIKKYLFFLIKINA